ncbi:MAG: NAD(P)H-dependent oxidoreductase [Pseudomonadota bacterium]
MKTLIVQGSSRPFGDTYQIAMQLARQLDADHIDLLDYRIYPFRYEQKYPSDDDFIQLVETKVLACRQTVFASPIYWYSMSGSMKVFFDRLSDLLKSRTDLGRQLRGRRMSVLSVGADATAYPSFLAPFRLSAEYLGMDYGPQWHGWLEDGEAQITEQ